MHILATDWSLIYSPIAICCFLNIIIQCKLQYTPTIMLIIGATLVGEGHGTSHQPPCNDWTFVAVLIFVLGFDRWGITARGLYRTSALQDLHENLYNGRGKVEVQKQLHISRHVSEDLCSMLITAARQFISERQFADQYRHHWHYDAVEAHCTSCQHMNGGSWNIQQVGIKFYRLEMYVLTSKAFKAEMPPLPCCVCSSFDLPLFTIDIFPHASWPSLHTCA